LVRTHYDSYGFNRKAATNPIYYIIAYLNECRRSPGYYGNAAMREFTKGGTWNSNRVPFQGMGTFLADKEGSEGEFVEEGDLSGHWYSPTELYWLLANYYRINPALAWPFVSWARSLPMSTDHRVDLAAVLGAFEYVSDSRRDPNEHKSIDMIDTIEFYLQQNPLPTKDTIPGTLVNSGEVPPPVTEAMLKEWRVHCQAE
jgi:hypothetical protein